jgi:hypothetical protein
MIKQTTTSFTPRNGESDEGQQNSASKQVETFTIDAPQLHTTKKYGSISLL